MAVNKALVDAMNKYHTAVATASVSPATDIIKGAFLVGSAWMKYKEDQATKTKAALEEYIIDDAPSGIDHWNEEGVNVITGKLDELKKLQNKYIRQGNKAGAIRVFKEAEKLMVDVNKLSGIFAKYKAQSDGIDGVKTMFSNVSNNDLINQLVNGDGNYTVFFDNEGSLKIQTFTEGDQGAIVWSDPINLSDVAGSVFLKANDIGGKITQEITRISGQASWAGHKGQLQTYLNQALDDPATLFSIFWDDVLPLSDGGMNSMTLADEYLKDNSGFDMSIFDPRSAAYQKLNEDERKNAQRLMKKYAIDKIMGMSKTFYDANATKRNKGNKKGGLFTSASTFTLSDGSEVTHDKTRANKVLNQLRNPSDGDVIQNWGDGNIYTYDESKEKWTIDDGSGDLLTNDQLADWLDIDAHSVWVSSGGGMG